MSVSEDDEILIKPQVIPASSPLVQKPHDEVEEKKRRIDEALRHYESTHPSPSVVVPATLPVATRHAAPSVLSTHTSKKKTPLFATRAHKVVPTKAVKRTVVTTEEPTALGLFVPTHIDPEAPIAAAVEAVKQREAERKAEEEAEATKPNGRYQQAVSVDLSVFASKKFIVCGVAWLLAIPLAIVLYHATSTASVVVNSNVLGWSLLVIEYALGAYGALGWIPLVVFYMREYKNQ